MREVSTTSVGRRAAVRQPFIPGLAAMFTMRVRCSASCPPGRPRSIRNAYFQSILSSPSLGAFTAARSGRYDELPLFRPVLNADLLGYRGAAEPKNAPKLVPASHKTQMVNLRFSFISHI